jgi:hypothetical protein
MGERRLNAEPTTLLQGTLDLLILKSLGGREAAWVRSFAQNSADFRRHFCGEGGFAVSRPAPDDNSLLAKTVVLYTPLRTAKTL